MKCDRCGTKHTDGGLYRDMYLCEECYKELWDEDHEKQKGQLEGQLEFKFEVKK